MTIIETRIDKDLFSPTKIFQLVLEGKLKKFPKRFWDNPNASESAAEISRYLFESVLHWSLEDIQKKTTKEVFEKNRLGGMLSFVYHGSVWQAINGAYPNQFREWEFKCAPSNFWNDETGKQTTKWLIEEKLKWTENDIKEKLSVHTFRSNGFYGMLLVLYNGSPWQAINAVYPNRVKEWELNITPKKFWNADTGKRATKWLIEEKLKWTDDDIKEKISKKVFVANGLVGMLNGVYEGSPWHAIDAAYPNRFKEWELQTAPKNFWNDETRIRATRWMIEEKLKWSGREIVALLRIQTFKDHGLYTMIRKAYSNNIYKAISAAYPGRFQKTDFERGRLKIFEDKDNWKNK